MAENVVTNSWPIIITWCNPEKNFRAQLSGIDFTSINISINNHDSYVYLLSQLFQLFSSNVFSINFIKKNTAIQFWQSIILTIHNSHALIITQGGLRLMAHILASTSHRQYLDVNNFLFYCCQNVNIKLFVYMCTV